MGVFDRWLLNTFSTFELVILITGGFVVASLIGLWIVQRLFPHFREGKNNDVAGFVLALVAVLYGIVLGFVIIVLYERLNSATENVQAEATALSQVYRDTLQFPAPVQRKIRTYIEDYSVEVRTNEWSAMKHGHDSELAWERVIQLETVLEKFQPQTPSDQIYANQAADKVNALVSNRRERLNQAEESLPPVFQILVIGGAGITMIFLFFFGMENRGAHFALVAVTSTLIGFSLALALILDYPFAGQVSVSNAPFHQGALSSLGP